MGTVAYSKRWTGSSTTTPPGWYWPTYSREPSGLKTRSVTSEGIWTTATWVFVAASKRNRLRDDPTKTRVPSGLTATSEAPKKGRSATLARVAVSRTTSPVWRSAR